MCQLAFDVSAGTAELCGVLRVVERDLAGENAGSVRITRMAEGEAGAVGRLRGGG